MNTQAPSSGIPSRENGVPSLRNGNSQHHRFARKLRVPLVMVSAILAGCATQSSPPEVAPLPQAHAHNDYLHARPLLDALDLGFCSIEADVFLVDGELLVAHDRAGCRAGQTIDRLYLEPLAARARAKQGLIYSGFTQPIILLVDIKADGEAAYRNLHDRLAAAPEVFTEFDRGVVYPRAVTVVISGSVPRAFIAAQARRFAFVDGRAADLEQPIDSPAPTGLVPLVSLPWRPSFRWDGKGEIAGDEASRLKALVKSAHDRGYLIRFWGVPETEACWRTLQRSGVDLINADDLARAAGVLRNLDANPPRVP
jgi:hypothetical protein